MPTNKEWLYSLEPHELTEWFDAEHTSNDTLGAKKVVSAESVDANDGNAASLKDSSDDTQNVTDSRETAETSNNSDENVTDSREKLEADIDRWAHSYNTADERHHTTRFYEDLRKCMLDVANRQAAITKRECSQNPEWIANLKCSEWMTKAHDLQAEADEKWNMYVAEHERVDELQAQVDELTAQRDNLADDLLTCNRERETLRKQLGIALDHAHDMLALVDMDGNVYDVGD